MEIFEDEASEPSRRSTLPLHAQLRQVAEFRRSAANSEWPPGLRSIADVAQAVRSVLDAPADIPMLDRAIEGLALSLASLEGMFAGAALVAARILDARVSLEQSVAEGATRLAFARRSSAHLFYIAAIRIAESPSHAPELLPLFGARFSVRLFDKSEPAPSTITKAIDALSSPAGAASSSWSEASRARATAVAHRKLSDAIQRHPKTAAAFGFTTPANRPAECTSLVDQFNLAFRRRLNDLKVWATRRVRAGGGGYGTFCSEALRDHGAALMDGVRAGSRKDIVAALEVMTTLPSASLQMLPVQTSDQAPTGALAWLDVPGGCFVYVLHMVVDRAARPDPGTEHLYLPTVQKAAVHLPAPLVEQLQALCARSSRQPMAFQDLVGDVIHAPRSAVIPAGAYRVTVRRLQESVPVALLKQGLRRWPVALATLSNHLVAVGRQWYGACRQCDIDDANAARCIALGWPAPASRHSDALVGTFTVAKPSAVSDALNFLADRADRHQHLATCDGIAKQVNGVAGWLAMLWALAFALRRWTEYAIAGDDVRAGAALIDDKDVHSIKGVPIPALPLVASTLGLWDALIGRAIDALSALGGEEALRLAHRLEAAVRAGQRGCPIFTVRGDGEVVRIGHHTWHSLLPASLRLRPSFARQFWAYQLPLEGMAQLVIDVLMRQQVPDLGLGSACHSVRLGDAQRELLQGMEKVVARLQLRLPRGLLGD